MISDRQKIRDIDTLMRGSLSWKLWVIRALPRKQRDAAKIAVWDRMHERSEIRKRITGEGK